jgi:3-deoxy-manno-octulosonate cytidylyltransferase (CMP-KDO synthetase)
VKILCVIPARYASTRLPGKPLADINGKPMIQRVYERACLAKSPKQVLVAADDKRVFDAIKQCGGQVMMTAKDHANGTDRLAEVAKKYTDMDIIINVQGDEPLIEPQIIDALAAAFIEDPELNMATIMTPIEEAEKENPNNVKVVTDRNGYALYFSRSLMPYPRVNTGVQVYKHIGIYAYKREFLLQYAAMESTPLENTESLEQLRALENGYKIKVLKSNFKFVGVDTQEDLLKVNEIYKALENS